MPVKLLQMIDPIVTDRGGPGCIVWRLDFLYVIFEYSMQL